MDQAVLPTRQKSKPDRQTGRLCQTVLFTLTETKNSKKNRCWNHTICETGADERTANNKNNRTQSVVQKSKPP